MPTADQRRQVRLLISDVEFGNAPIFGDGEVDDFLILEGGVVKLAAAQALDAIASNEALVSKVIKTQDGISTDGAKVADSLRKHAAVLRQQVADTVAAAEDEGFVFDIVDLDTTWPELTERPYA